MTIIHLLECTIVPDMILRGKTVDQIRRELQEFVNDDNIWNAIALVPINASVHHGIDEIVTQTMTKPGKKH